MSRLNDCAQSLYAALAMVGIDPNTIELGYSNKGDRVTIALPDIKAALSFPGDNSLGIEKDGWVVKHLTTDALEGFHTVMQSVLAIQLQGSTVRTGTGINGSSQENVLLKELLDRRLPEPDRDFRYRNEKYQVETVPDFAWEDLKVAVFVDGLYWHVSKDAAKGSREVAEAETPEEAKQRMKTVKLSAENDMRKRRALQGDGWTVIVCSDREIDNGTVEDIADQIEDAINSARERNDAASRINATLTSAVAVDDLI